MVNLPLTCHLLPPKIYAWNNQTQAKHLKALKICPTPGRTNGISSEAIIHVIHGMCTEGLAGVLPR